MKFEIEVPDDLKPFDINPMWWSEGGLISKVGFRAHLPDDEELIKLEWDVNGSPAKATEVFETKVWPHVREVFADEITEHQENLKQVQAVEAKKAKRVAKKKVTDE